MDALWHTFYVVKLQFSRHYKQKVFKLFFRSLSKFFFLLPGWAFLRWNIFKRTCLPSLDFWLPCLKNWRCRPGTAPTLIIADNKAIKNSIRGQTLFGTGTLHYLNSQENHLLKPKMHDAISAMSFYLSTSEKKFPKNRYLSTQILDFRVSVWLEEQFY